jgi:hypothetical protein
LIDAPYIDWTRLSTATLVPPLSLSSTEIQQSERTLSPLRPA